jgi:photosystem II stability/assembly factor-like uncharacterized protein/Spy/CpxP family protein refolding chaperone
MSSPAGARLPATDPRTPRRAPAWGRVRAPLTACALAALALASLPGPTGGQGGKAGPPTDQQVADHLRLTVEQVRRLRAQRGTTNSALMQVPEEKVPALLQKLDRGNVPGQRVAFANLSLKNDKGVIPTGARLRAIRQMGKLRTKGRPGLRTSGLPTGPRVNPKRLLPRTAGLKPDRSGWDSLGPHNIGGRTRALVINPRNPDIMYAGSASGGVWKTINAGEGWAPVSDVLADLAVSCLVMDPTDPDVLYAGTGESFGILTDRFNVVSDGVRGGGIYRTADGGKTWVPLRVPLNPSFQFVNRLALSPDGKVLLAAVGTLGDRTPTGKAISEGAGIYRSADPQRSDWRLVLRGFIGSLAFHPTDKAQVVAGALERGPAGAGPPTQGAFYSTDGGVKWQRAGPSQNWAGRVELAYARARPSVVYASVSLPRFRKGQGKDTFLGWGELWRSTDGGRNYHRQEARTGQGEEVAFLGMQGDYANTVWAGDPTRPDLVLVGGVDLWKSEDGGTTLAPISNWINSPPSPHADHHLIVERPGFDGKKNRTVFFGNDGGLYRADDVATAGRDARRVEGWTFLSHGYGVTQFYGAAGHARAGLILGGTQDNGTHLYRADAGGERWSRAFGGDGGYCAIDQDDPSYYYGEYVYLDIFRSRAGKDLPPLAGAQDTYYISGKRVLKVNGRWELSWKPAPHSIPDAQMRRANFIAPFILDPNNQNRLLAGGASLWVTDDARAPLTAEAGPKWAELKPPHPIKGDAGQPIPNFISALAVAKGDPNAIWVGYNNGDVFRSSRDADGKLQWQHVAVLKDAHRRMCTRIVIDPTESKRVYLTFGGYSSGNVARTETNGAAWTDLSHGLPEAPVRSLAIHPRNPKYLYLGTEIGVLASEDGGGSWSPTNEGPTNCRVDELFWMGETLVAATHGRGMYRIDLSGAVK